MEGPGNSVDAPRAARDATDALDALAVAFRASLAAPDVRHARAMIAQAAARGIAPGALYVSVVRPSLVDLQRPGRSPRARLAAGIGEAILADLVAQLPVSDRTGAGRAAVLSCREQGIEAVDGSVAMDFLECDGWTVDRLGVEVPRVVSDLTRDGRVELAVAVVAGPEDALRLAPVCTELGRLADPPVVILCDFSGRSRHRAASTALGADAVAHDPQELVRCAALRLPAPGVRRWGVRLSRHGAELRLTPTGCLDATSVGRLAEVAHTRLGSFESVIVDLRDVAVIEPAGVRPLAHWSDWLGGVPVRVVADEAVRARLSGIGVTLPAVMLQSAERGR